MASHDKIFVVEQNRDAQLRSLLTLETDVPKSKLHSIPHYSGLPMTSREIVDAVAAELGDSRHAALAAAT
jgi:2-oxoglutarate ferredoxin oxidoreductase subunit alpha